MNMSQRRQPSSWAEENAMIGTRIKTYLEDHGISQSHLSKKTGIVLRRINMSVNDACRISVLDYIKICEALNVSLYEFCPDEYQTRKKPNKEV